MHSGHAEAFGFLMALTFISYYLLCYKPLPPETSLRCFCDNIGVITNTLSVLSNEITRPDDTTNADHDLFLAIAVIANQCQLLELQFLHVKGHQDTKKD